MAQTLESPSRSGSWLARYAKLDQSAPRPPRVSFEFFPPSSLAMEESLWQSIEHLAPLAPEFISVTYGAGGSTRERTHATVKRILTETPLSAAAHLTCVDASRDDIERILDDYAAVGVRHIVALRGDLPVNAGQIEQRADGFAHAGELAAAIAKRGQFAVSVACYPEVHPQARSAKADLDHLKRKIDAGASRAISQFFFDPNIFVAFVDRARAAGIDVPIVPGILPITNFKRALDFAARCGTSVPASVRRIFEGLDETPEVRQLVSATMAAELCRELLANGVEDFHFYTLNRARLTQSICHLLGVRARPYAAGEQPA
ncbi:MAG: methylenetetrahydrofolate reductase [NAD(P)H] [Gammaproteobacteria bacterium]|nr:methylenetetrahydrofolate reductase [NAD(P)H] [Gammaproteobacteria bacterium]